MTSFDERMAQQREAAATAEAAGRASREREIAAAQETMRRLTVDFVKQATRIGWQPSTVVTVRLRDHQVRTGPFKTATRRNYFYDEALGEGWIVTDPSPTRTSEYGTPYTRVIVLRDGRWVDCGMSRTRLISADIAGAVEELPAGLRDKELRILDVSNDQTIWMTSFYRIADPEKFLIDELLRVERKM